MSNQSESSADICNAASNPTNYFRINTANPNESSDATDSKGMRSTSGGFVGGFALSTRTKLERSGHVTGLHLSSERRDRTDARQLTDHRILEDPDRIQNPKFTLQMDFLDMMTGYLDL